MADPRAQQADDDLRPMPDVKALCSQCYPSFLTPWEKQRETDTAMLVSPSGLVHHGMDDGWTVCGRDATGDRWWWRV